jgi:oligopeptide transport system ATP-binding protein
MFGSVTSTQSDTMNNKPILQVKNLQVCFFLKKNVLKAVNDVSFEVRKEETLCIVGESGCGKSVTALSILRLIQEPPGKIVSGQILMNDTDILRLSQEQVRQIRGRDIAMIFQDPTISLNPVLTIGYQISESFRLHKGLNKSEAWKRSIEMLKRVGIPSPRKRAGEYANEMSGGMRQRAMIAMALSCRPKLLIADEPTTALDVTIQAQVLDLMKKLKADSMASIIFITHDLGIVAEIADRVAVMYAGRIVETAGVSALFKKPMHPYTQALLESIPRVDQVKDKHGRRKPLCEIEGVVPNMINLPKGCAFAPRCSKAFSVCRERAPRLKQLDKERSVRCWLYDGSEGV